jgi:hypothetical protein
MIGGPVGALCLRVEGLDGKVAYQVCLLVAVNFCQLSDIQVESDIQCLVLNIGRVLVAQIIEGDVLSIEQVGEFVRLVEAVLLE